jgi:DNA-directed RNA polymerase specialized sigma24 family protein
MPPDDPQRLSQIDTLWTQLRKAHGQGDSALAAQAAILQRYAGAIFRYLAAAVKDPDLAQDLVQDFAVRFMEGRFQGLNPEQGRFRHYLKTALFHLVADHFRKSGREPAAAPLVDLAAPESRDSAFAEYWQAELIARTWAALGQWETETGQPFHTILRCRVEKPDADGAALAEDYQRRTGKKVTDGWWRTRLHQARAKFAELIVAEVKRTLVDPSRDDIAQELIDLGLYERCKNVLTEIDLKQGNQGKKI